ncbi:MAG: exonuclease SbcCD subunit D C-terminal domain-containing protein [Spirosomataceae bacterium]
MKILHTADWHLGKQLHKYSLEEDHRLFLDWLAQTILEHRIDLLLVSGDVFDTANPSNQALAQYYGFLKKLIGTGCHVVVTGGNHDSPGVLNAPRELLRFLDIKVVGSALENIQDELLHIETPQGEIVIAAVPYLREADLRRSVAGEGYDDRLSAMRLGIRRHYEQLADGKAARFAGLPSVAMGHLYVNGATVSESERDIHVVGGEAAFAAEFFPPGFDYIALGHIHKPQRIQNSDFIRYSGSPVPLSFSEREDNKYVLVLTLENNHIGQVEALPVPVFRELRSFTGGLDEVEAALKAYIFTNQLPSYVEVHVSEPFADPQKELYFTYLMREFDHVPFQIIKPRLSFENRTKGADELFMTGTSILDLTPQEVFQKRIASENLDDETQGLLAEAFEELWREVGEQN